MSRKRGLQVLRASRRLPPLLGGQEIHVAELTKALGKIGIHQEVMFAEGSAPSEVPSVRVWLPVSDPSILADALFGFHVARRGRMGQLDVVHTHGDAPVARGGSVAASRAKAIHLHTFHAGIMQDRARRTVLGAFLPKGSYYLAVSEAIARDLVDLGVRSERVWVRPSGVRAAFFEGELVERESLVVIGGRIGPLRRVREFVDAWVRERIEGVTLVVVGGGPDAQQVRKLAEAVPSVRLMGELGEEQLADLLRSASTGLVLSKPGLSEGTPTLLLEMLAAGCVPLVASGAGLGPRLVRELGLGVVVEGLSAPREVAELTLRYQKPEYESHREKARAAVAAAHGWPAVARSIAELYGRLHGPG